MLDVRRLVLLRELSIRGTISAVARAMNLAPSSVSEQLSLLERETKTQLLRRVGRNVQLTEAAMALVERVEPILGALEEAETALISAGSAGGALSGRVRLAVFQSAALVLIPPALSLLRERHPALRLEMVQYEPEEALHETWARDFDVVVAEQYPGHSAPHWPGLDRRQLLRDELQLAVPAGLTIDGQPLPAGEELATVLQHRPLPWVMEPRGTATRHWAEQLIRSAGHEPDVRFVSADLQSHVKLVESGNALALLPGLTLVDHPQRLRRISLRGRPLRTVFTSIRSSSARSPAVVAVRAALEEAAQPLDAENGTDHGPRG
ncbi:LysR family transcriptional regulator [Citricoccus zhacaiensis]|uniref:LysR family transcriptional regulator n=1 Tax=Citricoccus zhacaiensis TaxID=489142 RepID=A0ABQ2M5J4_9MICC|nr:LysR family transcriptional regulator [Citricoccus zhacaiensis]GGO47465.1 LysR family transcriptional regulator [Citricoccus zhacaiensis]